MLLPPALPQGTLTAVSVPAHAQHKALTSRHKQASAHHNNTLTSGMQARA